MEENYELLNHLDVLKIFDYPILAGLSRKSMIYKKLKIDPEQALNGTTVLNTLAYSKGARLFRVHDVKPVKEMIDLLSK
jgi:dihydropteroate synthase